MPRLEKWFDEDPRRPTAVYACALARDRFWRDHPSALIGTHPDWPDVTYLLRLGEEIAHALVLVLSRLPAAERLPFAETFIERRTGGKHPPELHVEHRMRLALAAQIALLVLDLSETTSLQDDTVVDLLQGAAQGDDLAATPDTAVGRLRTAVAAVRSDPGLDDVSDPHAVASLAVVEVLDPSSESVAVKEVLARAAFATVECRSTNETLSFLLEADRILAGAE